MKWRFPVQRIVLNNLLVWEVLAIAAVREKAEVAVPEAAMRVVSRKVTKEDMVVLVVDRQGWPAALPAACRSVSFHGFYQADAIVTDCNIDKLDPLLDV